MLCSPEPTLWATILNANDISGEPIAVVKLPQRVPNGLHGNWCPMEV
jgi:carotenoid cleavage dioxygenase-like enzyme